MPQVEIHVTTDHIYRGQPGGWCNCPISLAILDAGFDDVIVASETSHSSLPAQFLWKTKM